MYTVRREVMYIQSAWTRKWDHPKIFTLTGSSPLDLYTLINSLRFLKNNRHILSYVMTLFSTHFSINHLDEIGHNFFFLKKIKIQDIKQIKQYIKLQEVKYIY